mgnify:CR=1 FL=1|tara:strand:- start:1219 stop:2241 length:1023 start_codon:yes stop_codon:yes gene_type:complete
MLSFVHSHPLVRRFFTIGILPIAIGVAGIYIVGSILMGIFFFVFGDKPDRHFRLALMFFWYLIMELFGVLIALILWVLTIFGYKISSDKSQRIHAFVQYLWVASILGGAELFLRTKVEFPDDVSFGAGRFIIAAQHSSFFDALIPTILIGKYCENVIPRHVLKSDLLLSPSLDIYGNRLPNQFVNRGSKNSEQEIAGVKRLANNLGSDALVIFPEGTFRTKDRYERVIQKINLSDPDRVERVRSLKYLLPIKPGGLLAMVNANPESDLFLVAHRGFEAFGSFKEIFANIPFADPVDIYIKHIPAEIIPRETRECLRFIDFEWLALDKWLESRVVSNASTS